MEKVDLIIAYVDNNDSVWQKTYFDYCFKTNQRIKIVEMKTIRYEDRLCLLPYQIKLVKKNMPFINNIYLLLSNIEQKPKDLPSDIKVVLHKEFIPYQFLPTFNSCTIEMFLWNIPNLSEKFIYANDDMLPIKPLKETDFFDKDKVKLEFLERNIMETNTMYRHQCLKSYNTILDKLGMKYNGKDFISPIHSFTPMLKSHCVEIYKLMEIEIKGSITSFRNYFNYNQYIFPLYEHFKYGSLLSNIDFLYTQLKEDIDLNHDIVCINIVPKDKVNALKVELDKLCK